MESVYPGVASGARLSGRQHFVHRGGRTAIGPWHRQSSAERDTAHRMNVAHCNPITELTTNDGGHNITITLQSR